MEIGAEVTKAPDTIEATEVDGVVAATEKGLRTLFEELARQEARAAAISCNVPNSLCILLDRPEVPIKEYAAKCLERLATLVQGRCACFSPPDVSNLLLTAISISEHYLVVTDTPSSRGWLVCYTTRQTPLNCVQWEHYECFLSRETDATCC